MPYGKSRAYTISCRTRGATTVISSFLAKYPKITLEAHLRQGGFDPDDDTMDVLFGYGARPETHHPVIPLGTPHIRLFASPRYLQRAGVPQVPADLAQHEMVRLTTLPMEVRGGPGISDSLLSGKAA